MSPNRWVLLGERLQELRHGRDLSQRDLAALVGRSVSWVSQVERGVLHVDRLLVLQQLALAVGAPASEFADMLRPDDESEALDRPFVGDLRLALAGHPVPETLLGGASTRPRRSVDLAALGRDVEHGWGLVHASAYEELGPLLARLIHDLELGTRTDPEASGEAFRLLADTYQLAAAMLMKLGDYGAGWVAAERAIAVGDRCGDRCMALAGQYRMAHTLVGSNEHGLARHVLRQAVRGARTVKDSNEPGLVSLVGACALLLAVLDARDHDPDAARQHLRTARTLARRLGGDRDEYGTEFGPTNVAVHEVAVSVELGDFAEAIRLAEATNTEGLSPERQARFLIDVARARGELRQVAAAVRALEEAEAIAPEEIHGLPRVRHLLRDLKHYAGRRRFAGLTRLEQVTHN